MSAPPPPRPPPAAGPPPPVRKPPPAGPPPGSSSEIDQVSGSGGVISTTDKQELSDLLANEDRGAHGRRKVAIIGAGPCGQALLRAFKQAQAKGVNIPDVVCFEKQGTWGGMWNYTWRKGLDQYGEPVHSSMYRYLWANVPKEVMEFSDYTWSEHYGQDIPSFPPRAIVADYIRGRYEKSNLRDCIKLSTVVRRVALVGGRYKVTHHDLAHDVQYTEDFDHVVVATGHFSTPVLPEFPGFDQFSGQILHSHDVRDPNDFKDKAVLVVGRSYSAEDIGAMCVKYGARSVTTSWRSRPMGWAKYKLPANWDERPLLESVEDKTCYFKDRSSKRIDVIILCTGYQHHFPFLDGPLRLPEKIDNKFYPARLYRGVVCEDLPSLFFMGMQNLAFSLPLFDAQAYYIRDIILGTAKLPSMEDMRNHTNMWKDNEAKITSFQQAVNFQADYVRELAALTTDVPTINVAGLVDLMMQWEQSREENLLGVRDIGYRSLYTGRVSPVHANKWMSALDDDPSIFLRETKPYEPPEGKSVPAVTPAPPRPAPASPAPPAPSAAATSPKPPPPSPKNPAPPAPAAPGRGPPPPPK